MMKKLIAVLALTVAMINSAMAASPEFCAQASETAEVIMRNRQTGVSVIDMMKIANSSESTKKMLTGLINEAFAEPAYSTPEYQQKAIREFGSQQYLMCLAAE